MRLHFLDDGRVQVRTGKVELGQGILTAFAQIAADTLGVPVSQVQVLDADTALGPNEGVTSGSLSVQVAGAALREACLQTRRERQERIGAGGLASRDDDGFAPHRTIGHDRPRSDLPAKLRGEPAFIHDLAPEGVLHGRVLHPPRPLARLLEADLDAARAVPGVRHVERDGQLLGVIAEQGAAADRALEKLAATARWSDDDAWLDDRAALDALPRLPADSSVVDERIAPDRGTVPIVRTLRARYRKLWIAHASIAPSCALAQWDDGALQVWTHSQGIFELRRDLALAFGVDATQVRVRHAHGAGCYGHNGADDVAFDAAWLARLAPGRTVRVHWRREDEMSRAPLGPGMVVALEAGLDADGEVQHWQHEVWSPGHSSRPGRSATPALLGAWQTARPFDRPASINMPLAVGGGAERNAVPGYALPAWRIVSHKVEVAAPRSSALRSLGAFGNVFAAECFVDEVAQAAGVDPLEWRRRHLRHDARALAVLEAAAARAGWGTPLPGEGRGRGIAFARYKNTGAWCAVVAEVEVGAQLKVTRLTLAADLGLVINPDGAIAQLEGGALQATSWTLMEAVRFDAHGVTTARCEDYPVLRFSDVPVLDVLLMPSTEASLGAGEAALGPTAAAIGNALHAALGVRVCELPLTAERIAAAIHADEGSDSDTATEMFDPPRPTR